ncbi:MAG: tripartite tricarboxylate transporter substrate binding protein [Alphaproteobacteria bacterium]|nr:tripartite tricarboxylate transporter substrate binding protein [Alphaproteobacteria bacterium]
MTWIIPSLAILLAALAPVGAAAQEAFPQKPIEITVLFPAGSSADITARLLADGMTRQLGTNVIVVNRPGAGGAIAYQTVARRAPDGYSLVWNSNSISTTHHSGALDIGYDAFDAVAQALVESPLLAVRGAARWSSLAALVAEARTRPKMITVANSGVGSHTHISAVALFQTAGVQMVDVPFGAVQVVTSLVSGEVDAAVQLPAALAEYAKVGQLRLLATLTTERDPAFPDTPTAREQGVDVSLEAWRGIAVPTGTPKPVIATLEAAIRKTVLSPDFAHASAPLGVRPAFLPAAAFGQRIAREDAELARLIELIGLKKS